MIYWNTQEVVQALIGGGLIALSATLNLYTFGRITGLSGIFNSVFKYDCDAGFKWKISFLCGMILLPVILGFAFPEGVKLSDSIVIYLFDTNAQSLANLSIGAWILGGILVGWGTRMGNGCTSGHGVCGIPRLSIRSMIAVITFMGVGIAIATLKYHTDILNHGTSFGESYEKAWKYIGITLLGIILVLVVVMIALDNNGNKKEYLLSMLYGIIFGFGLVLSGMCRISKIQGFLIIKDGWDPTLMFVMMSAVCINLFTFRQILKRELPLYTERFMVPPPNAKIDLRLVIGAAIFGLGWGISGLCPGPGLANFFLLTHAILWIVGLIAGQLAFDLSFKKYQERQKKKQSMNDHLVTH